MRIGKRRHRRACEHGRLQAVAAGSAVLDDEMRQAFANFFKEAIAREHLLPHTFAERVCIYTTESCSFVIVYLQVAKVTLIEKVNNLPREIVNRALVVQIPEAPFTHSYRLAIAME